MLLDDIDGTEAMCHIRLSVNGTSYALDVSEANGKAFDEAIAPFLKVARKLLVHQRLKVSQKKFHMQKSANGHAKGAISFQAAEWFRGQFETRTTQPFR